MIGVSVTVSCAGTDCTAHLRVCGVTGDNPTQVGIDLAEALGWTVVEHDHEIGVYCSANCRDKAAL